MIELKVDWCSHVAAKYAVEHWHYSHKMPSAQNQIGVWEDKEFIGAVVFGIGAGNATHGGKYGLKRTEEMAELVRVALREHKTAVTKIIARSLELVKSRNPGLRLIISFADELGHGHIGTIYQAGNWIYTGAFEGDGGFLIHGKVVHSRTVGSRGWTQSVAWLQKHVDPKCTKAKTKKYRYLMPLDKKMRRQILPLSKPYPRPVGVTGNTPDDQSVDTGSSPVPG